MHPFKQDLCSNAMDTLFPYVGCPCNSSGGDNHRKTDLRHTHNKFSAVRQIEMR
jgi:hypothetical protein